MPRQYPVIDFHVHVFPDRLSTILPESTQGLWNQARRSARHWMRPLISQMHKAQPMIRHLPGPVLNTLDSVVALAPIPSLVVEGTIEDLGEALQDAQVDLAVVIAHPRWIPNDFVLGLADRDPRIIAAVNIPSGTKQPGEVLKEYVRRGAKLLKIHPPADGEGADSPRYRVLLETAEELKLPVILHTGCMHSSLFYKKPEEGHAARYAEWFERHPDLKFVLAHMNYHEPNVALDLAEQHPNVYVDTSWQPAEMIGEAVRRIGDERVLFATDWPFVGNNLYIGRKRVQKCLKAGTLSLEQARAVLGWNAVKLLGLDWKPSEEPDAT